MDTRATTTLTNGQKIKGRLTTDHAASSYGQPVFVADDGQAYNWVDIADIVITDNTKFRSQEIYAAAVELVEPVDVSETVEIRPIAHQLVERTGCHYDTAKRHIAKAVRRKRHGLLQEQPEYTNWGGPRKGSGYPKGEPRKRDNKTIIKDVD